MPDKNKANLGLAPVFLLIQRCARVLYACINALTRLVLPKNMGARLAGNQNAAIFDDFWQSRTPTYYTYFKREFDKKGVNIGVLAGSNTVTCGYLRHVVFLRRKVDRKNIQSRSCFRIRLRLVCARQTTEHVPDVLGRSEP